MVEECCGRNVKICKGHMQYMYKKVVFLLCSICVLLLGNSRRLNFICRRFGTLSLSHLHTYPPMKMGQSSPKRRHIKFRRRGITQKKHTTHGEILKSRIRCISFRVFTKYKYQSLLFIPTKCTQNAKYVYYQQFPPTCFGVCHTIFNETMA